MIKGRCKFCRSTGMWALLRCLWTSFCPGRNQRQILFRLGVHICHLISNCRIRKLYQKEHEYIKVYTSKFEEINWFSETLTEKLVIDLFSNNVRKLLKVHNVKKKRSKTLWNAFICKLPIWDNEEPRERVVAKSPLKKLVLAIELKELGQMNRREEKMAKKQRG